MAVGGGTARQRAYDEPMPRVGQRSRVFVFLLGLGALMASGCAKSVPTKAKLARVTPKEMVVEVATEPGMRASVRSSRATATANAQGIALVSVPRASWPSMGSVTVDVEGSSFGRRRFGRAALPFDFDGRKLTHIPDTDAPLWAAIVEAGRSYTNEPKKTATLRMGADHVAYWDPATPLHLVIATPAGAGLELGSKPAVRASPTGLTPVEVTTADLAPFALTSSLVAEPSSVDVELPARVSAGGADAVVPLRISVDTVRTAGTWLAPHLQAVARGETFGSRQPRAQGILLLTSWGVEHVVHLGAGATAGEVRFVALETKRRHHEGPHGELCAQHSYEDVTVTVYEAATGKKVASKAFAAEAASCPVLINLRQHDVYRPTPETISAWLTAAMPSWK